jgi:hypothetical protein
MSLIPQGPCAIAFPREHLLTLDDNKIGPVVLQVLDHGAQEVRTAFTLPKVLEVNTMIFHCSGMLVQSRATELP